MGHITQEKYNSTGEERKPNMTAEDVLSFYNELDQMGIPIWVDGGWGVDALLAQQTRSHGDLDIAIEKKHIGKVGELLESRGWKIVPRDDLSEHNFHLGDDEGREIDFHVIEFDQEGRGVMGAPEDNSFYPAGALTGTGTIKGQIVRTIDPEHMVKFHTGYPLRESDYADVKALCDKFGIEYPDEYKHLKDSN
jgi:lincosamide nucleotidyltransferase A/C/D/E